MAGKDQDAEDLLLSGLVSDELAQAYGKLSAVVRVSKDEAAEFLGDAWLMEELSRRGLARVVGATPEQPATFQPVPELTALQTALVQRQADILAGQEQLLAGQRRLADIQARPEPVCKSEQSPSHMVRVITSREEIARLTGYLINSAHKEWMTLETSVSEVPLSQDNFINNPYGKQLRIRSIFDAASLRTPGALGNLQLSVENGEQVRILQTLVMKMQLADADSVLLPLTPTGTGGAILVQGGGPLVRGMRDYFERLWKTAVPYGAAKPAEGCPLSETQLEIVRLLMLGHTDQSIADLMGCSKSKIERHMDQVGQVVGLKGRRFALAVALERRGWIPREGAHHG
jgi:DNA-binding CsgD family transcriptional regulator